MLQILSISVRQLVIGSGQSYDGLMSHFHFVMVQVAPSSLFGETDQQQEFGK